MKSRNYINVKYGLRHFILDLTIVLIEAIFRRVKRLLRRNRP